MQSVVPAPATATSSKLLEQPPPRQGRREWFTRDRLARNLLAALNAAVARGPWRVQGQYSVSKLDAYQAFCRATRRDRVLTEVLAAPLPSLAVNLLLEAIPLADPALGWRHSGSFFARMFLSAMVSSMPPYVVKREYIAEFPVRSWRAITLHSLAQSAVALGVDLVIVSASGLFPFPFLQFVPIVPMTLTGRLLGFNARFEGRHDILERQRGVDGLLALEQLPIVIYPMTAALFMAVSPVLQLWLSAALPLLKLAVRAMLAHAGRFDTDLLGGITCAAGHLFHVLFVATCLQNSKSWETMAIVAAFHVAQMLFNAREITVAAARVHRSFVQVSARSAARLGSAPSTLGAVDVVAAALEFAADVHVGVALHSSQPSAFLSTYQRYRRPEFVARHQAILALERPARPLARLPKRLFLSIQRLTTWPSALSSRRSPWTRRHALVARMWPASSRPSKWQAQSVRVRPAPKSPVERGQTPSWTLDALTAENKRKHAFVLELCAALHQTEMILLRSFTTISMLLFYVVYLVVVFWLPNRAFFITMEPMSTLEAVGATVYRLLSLCALEGGFFAVYLALLRARLGVRGVDQLAFVLSSQRVLFQAKCIALPVTILGFPLVHFGNSSILRFGSNDQGQV